MSDWEASKLDTERAEHLATRQELSAALARVAELDAELNWRSDARADVARLTRERDEASDDRPALLAEVERLRARIAGLEREQVASTDWFIKYDSMKVSNRMNELFREQTQKQRDAARAEVEVLKFDKAELIRERDEFHRDRAALRAEVERLRERQRFLDGAADIAALQADVARLTKERDDWQEHHHVAVRKVEQLREALTQSNRYIDEAVKKRMLRYDEAVAKYGVRSPEVREQSKLLHDLINGTRNSFDSAHRVLAALAGSPVETRVCPHGMAEDECRRAYGTPCPGAVEPRRVREVLDLTGEPTPEVLDRLSEVQSYVRCGEPSARDRALAERVRLHVAEQFFLVMERGDVSLSDAFDKMRATPLDALLEEP